MHVSTDLEGSVQNSPAVLGSIMFRLRYHLAASCAPLNSARCLSSGLHVQIGPLQCRFSVRRFHENQTKAVIILLRSSRRKEKQTINGGMTTTEQQTSLSHYIKLWLYLNVYDSALVIPETVCNSTFDTF